MILAVYQSSATTVTITVAVSSTANVTNITGTNATNITGTDSYFSRPRWYCDPRPAAGTIWFGRTRTPKEKAADRRRKHQEFVEACTSRHARPPRPLILVDRLNRYIAWRVRALAKMPGT